MLLQMIPPQCDLWAIFTDEDGEPEVAKVTNLGLFEGRNDKNAVSRQVVCYAIHKDMNRDEVHLFPADFFPDFVAVAYSPDPEPWREKAKAKRAALTKKAADEAAGKSIIVPNGGKIAMATKFDA